MMHAVGARTERINLGGGRIEPELLRVQPELLLRDLALSTHEGSVDGV